MLNKITRTQNNKHCTSFSYRILNLNVYVYIHIYVYAHICMYVGVSVHVGAKPRKGTYGTRGLSKEEGDRRHRIQKKGYWGWTVT